MLEKTKDIIQRKENKEKLMNLSLDKLENESEIKDISLEDTLLSVDDAFEDYKKEFDKSTQITYPEIQPIGSRIVTTAMLSNIVDMKGMLLKEDFNLNFFEDLKNSVSDTQVVVAKGPHAKQVEIGDLVKIEFKDFTMMQNPGTVHRKEVFSLPLEVIDKVKYLTMHENNIKFIYKKTK